MESNELVERYAILLLGSKENPIPSSLHLQKEMFILSKLKESLKEDLSFQEHYFGPFSQILDEVIKHPAYIKDAFDFERNKIVLSEKGNKEFYEMFKENSYNNKFLKLISSIKLIRSIYDKLSKEEILFLIYETYPEYTEISKVSDNLIKNKIKREKIIKNLFLKGTITEKRYLEFKNERI